VRDAGAFAGPRKRLLKLGARLEEFPVDALRAPQSESQKIALPLGQDAKLRARLLEWRGRGDFEDGLATDGSVHLGSIGRAGYAPRTAWTPIP